MPPLLPHPSRRAWVLNLDAEHELEVGHRYQPTRRLERLVTEQRARLADELLAADDVVLDQAAPSRAAEGRIGLAWCPTPRALARLSAAGAEPLAAPSFDVLRTVNARPFAAATRAPLAEASFVKTIATHLEEVLAQLARAAPQGWLVRRTFGAAGRARRRLHAGEPSAEERAWLLAGLGRGPLVIEPHVTITREYTRSGWVHPGGRVTISQPCFQETTSQGAWTRSEPTGREVPRGDDELLGQAAASAGADLARAGYFGPFGIDAFRHRRVQGSGEVLNPLSEINARFTMDWSTAMGER